MVPVSGTKDPTLKKPNKLGWGEETEAGFTEEAELLNMLRIYISIIARVFRGIWLRLLIRSRQHSPRYNQNVTWFYKTKRRMRRNWLRTRVSLFGKRNRKILRFLTKRWLVCMGYFFRDYEVDEALVYNRTLRFITRRALLCVFEDGEEKWSSYFYVEDHERFMHCAESFWDGGEFDPVPKDFWPPACRDCAVAYYEGAHELRNDLYDADLTDGGYLQ